MPSHAEREAELFGPVELRAWMTKGGRRLQAAPQAAYRWLAAHAERLPSEFEFKLADLGRCFFATSSSTSSDWVSTLEGEGLLEIVKGRRGSAGGLWIRLYDVRELAEVRRARIDPQLQLPIVEEADLVPFAPNHLQSSTLYSEDGSPLDAARPGASMVESGHAHLLSSHHYSEDGSACVAAGDLAQVPLALVGALSLRLGEDFVETHLGRCRWELGTTSKLLVPSDFQRDYLRDHWLGELRAAVADCGLPPLELAVDPSLSGRLGKLRSSERYSEDESAQQPTLVVRSSCRASNQPTNQPNFSDQRGESGDQAVAAAVHPLLARAAALYGRIGDPTVYRWIAIATVVLVADGVVTAADVERLLAERGGDFNTAIKQLAGSRWPKIGWFKSRLLREGIKWKRSWDRGTASEREPR
jgi:hypothetical protein